MTVTMKHVAALAGVSPKTVSNVVNGHRYISADTRRRVESAIAELGYRVNLSARSLRSGRTGTIMLALPELTHPFFAELAAHFISEAAERGLRVLIEQTGGAHPREHEVLHAFSRTVADGLILSPLVLGPPESDAVRMDYPLVVLGEWIRDASLDVVATRDAEAGRAATELLIAGGSRRIVVLGAYDDWEGGPSNLRTSGYRCALAEAGIPLREELVVESRDWHRVDGARAIERLIDAGVEFDGVFALNDAMALGALSVLFRHRIAVPEQVAVVGYDDVDEARFAQPPLSTIATDMNAIARLSLDRLMAQVDGQAPGHLDYAGFELVRRESTRGSADARRIGKDRSTGGASRR